MFKTLFPFIFLIVIAVISFNLYSFCSIKQTNGVVYTIRVGSGKHQQTFIAKKIITQDDHCVKFIDNLGIEQNQCGNTIGVSTY